MNSNIEKNILNNNTLKSNIEIINNLQTIKSLNSNVEKEKDFNSLYVDCAVFPAYKKKRFERRLIFSSVKVEFEGILFNAPIGYNTILRIIYGDYMQLPPKEKQIGHHGFTAYWR